MPSPVIWVDDVPVVDAVGVWGPYRKQAEFLLSPHRNRFFCAGRGAGKSWALGLDVLLSALINPGCKGLFLGRTEDDLVQNLLPYFEMHRQTLIDATGYDVVRYVDKGAQTYHFKNGSSFVYLGYEHVNRLRKFSVTWVAMDEVEHTRVSHEDILRAVKPCIRIPGPRQGIAIASSPNGLQGFAALFHKHQLLGTKGWWVTRCPSYASPYITQEDLDDWRETLSADGWKQEIEAICLRAKELIYHQFSPAKHIRAFDAQAILAQPEARLVVSVDWGLNHAAALAIAVDGGGTWWVYDEITAEPASRGHWQEQLDQFIKKQPKPPFLITPDRAVPLEIVNLKNTWGRLHKTQVITCDSRKEQEVKPGIAQVQAKLDPASTKPPYMYFSDKLNRLDDRPTATIIPALEGYRFRKNLDGSLTDIPLKDDKNDHSADCLRMAVVVGNRFRDLNGGRLPMRDLPDGWHPDGKSQPHQAHW